MLLLAALGLCDGAFGQQVVTLEFSFSNPGARSLGFGGAFAALADDATAAYANPAGLVQLVEPEVSVEGRFWSYETPFIAGGRAGGLPTGIGRDTAPGLRVEESQADFTELSFLSYVYPLRHWSLAFYRHQMARFETSSGTNGLFADGSGFADTDRWGDTPGSSSLDIVAYGFSAGYRVNEALSLGIGVSLLDIDLRTESAAFLPDDESIESFFGENTFLPERMIEQTTTWGDTYSGSLIAGLLFRASENWRIGGFYRAGFDYTWHRVRDAGPAAPSDFPAFSSSVAWVLPDVYGLGIAYQSGDGRSTYSLEWDHVEYSDLLDNFVVAFSAVESRFQLTDLQETIPDADEIHLGAEYVFLRSRPIVALRLGAWLDPDHRIQVTRGNVFQQAILPPGDDQIHYTAGVGLAFETFQVDLAADISDLVDTASISAVYRL